MNFRHSPTAAAVRSAFQPPQHNPLDLVEKLPDSDLVSLEIAHADALHELTLGQPTAQTLWDWVSNVLTWSRAADLMALGQDEMAEQLALCMSLIDRFKRTGRVGFSGPELHLARHGVDVMDALASQTTRAVARQAALWSEEQLARLRANPETIPSASTST